MSLALAFRPRITHLSSCSHLLRVQLFNFPASVPVRPIIYPAQSLSHKLLRKFSTPPPNKPSSHLPVLVTEGEEREDVLIYNRPKRRQPKKWYKSPVLYVLLFLEAVSLYLGFWQLRRLEWKLGLIDELEDKLRREVLQLPRNVNMDVLNEFEYRLFELHGHYDTSRPLFVGPRQYEDKHGYHVIMPFRRKNGGPDILVNRGFVSNDDVIGTGINKHLRNPLKNDDKTQTIVVLLPRIYPPSRFALPNTPEQNLWIQVNPAQMSHWLNEQCGHEDIVMKSQEPPKESALYRFARTLTPSFEPAHTNPQDAFRAKQTVPTLPIYMEQIFGGSPGEAMAMISQGVPVGRPARIELRNQHAEYAMTWFSLTGITTLMFIYMLRKGRRSS